MAMEKFPQVWKYNRGDGVHVVVIIYLRHVEIYYDAKKKSERKDIDGIYNEIEMCKGSNATRVALPS